MSEQIIFRSLSILKLSTFIVFSLCITNIYAMDFKIVNGYQDCAGCILIIASGQIENNTVEQFEAVLATSRQDKVTDTTIVFDSPGGALMKGLEFGELVRRSGLSTHIGSFDLDTNGDVLISEGVCASSCAYAFLGGKRRSMEPSSKYGLHQVSSNTDQAVSLNEAMALVQDLVANIAKYIVKMGASNELAIVATQTASNDIDWLAPNDLVKYGITNSNGLNQQQPWSPQRSVSPYQETWTIEAVLSDGSEDRFILKCDEIPIASNKRGHAMLIMSSTHGLNPENRLYKQFIPTEILFLIENEIVSTQNASLYFGPGIGTGMSVYSLNVPYLALKQAFETSSAISIDIGFPQEVPTGISDVKHTLPILGLGNTLSQFENRCPHLMD